MFRLMLVAMRFVFPGLGAGSMREIVDVAGSKFGTLNPTFNSLKSLLRKLLPLVVLLSSASATAGFSLTTTSASSDAFKTSAGTQQPNSGTIRVTATISGSSIIFAFSHYTGKTFTTQIAGRVYRDLYSNSNLVGQNTASGASSVSVSIPLSTGNYKALFAFKDSSNNDVAVYFNSATFNVTQTNGAPTVSNVSAQVQSDGSLQITYTANDVDSDSMGADFYLSDSGGNYSGRGNTKKSSGTIYNGTRTISYSASELASYLTSGNSYRVRADIFDTQHNIGNSAQQGYSNYFRNVHEII